MWRPAIFGIILICLVLSSNVQGSCLEYGHSCWGAHGKRSSGSAVVGSKARLAERNSRGGNQLNLLEDENANRFVGNKFDINEATTSAEISPHLATSAEDNSADSNYSTKERNNYLGQRQLKFPLHKSNSESSNTALDHSNRKSETADSREERQHILHLQQQQRKYPQHIERWHKLPIFGLRRPYVSSPLALTDVAPLELPKRNVEKDLLQQIGQLTGERYDDVGAYYDFP
ncbi:neuropeptide CCHamide-1 [Zeugodacus cucurbitae]|uniref:neuropeptide CCHamide-1 n=1 Tax=Zeugodacus cucurbitae TaxID=28588 RepID=UPI0023D942CF|nr:neuropeptide CCHamide-1 [Zeugodacus cucurbitae]